TCSASRATSPKTARCWRKPRTDLKAPLAPAASEDIRMNRARRETPRGCSAPKPRAERVVKLALALFVALVACLGSASAAAEQQLAGRWLMTYYIQDP